jgi:FkbH-like protein
MSHQPDSLTDDHFMVDQPELVRISQDRVLDFARWTGDCNPIHVDPVAAKESAFGGNICHGMLVLIESLAHWDPELSKLPRKLESLDVQFRSEVRPESISQVHFQKDDAGLTGKVSSGDTLQMELVARWKNPRESVETSAHSHEFSWMQTAASQGVVTSVNEQPQPWTADDFRPGLEFPGVHRFAQHQPEESSKFSPVQEQVFGLCSFIVGMRVPGLSSLFTRLKTTFVDDPQATQELFYRLTLLSYDDNFRILEMRLDVATSGMQPVAVCEIQCYVRFPKLDPQLATYEGDVPDLQKQAMSGKVALVCGASRGLGAEIAAAMGSVDCICYLASRSRSKTTDALVAEIQQRGGKVHVLLGDVGDPAWCKATAEQLQSDHGHLDYLILNACELPELKKIADSDPLDSANYIQRNVGLYQQPLMHLLGLVKRSNGTIVAISSSAVDEIPSGFGDYVSVKLALEGSIRTVSKENSNLRCLIVRPPQLQTPWNDTPIRAVGSVSVPSVASEILKSVSQESWDKNLRFLSKFPKRKQIKKSRKIESELALVASFTLDPIHQGFEGWSEVLDLGIEPKIAPYAQVLQQALDPSSIASRSTSGSVFLLRVEDFFHELPKEFLSSSPQIEQVLKQNVAELTDAMKSHRAMAKGPTLMLLCPSFGESEADLLFTQAEKALEESLKGISGLTFWRSDAFHSMYRVDDREIQDRLRDTIGHIPYVDAYYDLLATLCIRYLMRRLQPPKKVVVLDCDNTLWQGVVGEVGPEGISFEPAHHRLHERLGELADSGMLLCLCSKNEPEDVWAVFDQRPDFGLKRDQIVASKINWMPKGQNIQELAKSLNLGLDSFVFLDDNPVECAEVRSTCPTVLTLQWYHENALAEQLIDHLWELDIHGTTKEDRERTRMYREEFQRQEVQASASNFQAFIDSLQLVVDFTEVTDEFVQRASQLTLRTNQFNFSTIRRNESEILNLQKNPNVDMRIVQVRDRFGDYGVVGLLIAIDEPNGYMVDTFLLSCRVLGRGVEHRIASYIATLAQQRGNSSVRWIYKPTEKNAPAKLFLQRIAGTQSLESNPTDITIPIEQLLGLKYQADPSYEPIEESSSKEPKAKIEVSVDHRKSVRVREQQIKKCVEELSDWANISKVFRREVSTETVASVANVDIEDRVLDTFGSVLGIEPQRVKSLDRLDALGCDSLQIVGITVSLTKVFPQLPPTLLFEYRSVSEIVEQISRICNPSLQSTRPALDLSSARVRGEDTVDAKIDSEIAIVGIGLLSAAGADQEALWNCLLQRKSMVVPLPKMRDGYIGEMVLQHPYYGSLLSDVTGFDPEFFGISPREAQYMDPQMRTVLQSAWHALEDAGAWRSNFDRSMGVFVGVMYQCYGRVANQIATTNASVYRCWEGFGVANRLSQILGVSGPSLAIDTACSSSATALHYAVESLRDNLCNSALVSGVNLILDPCRIAQLDNLGILTRTGKCVPFGDQADGTVIGEGAVAVVLKRLSDALRDSDRIYAVIKGTGLSVGAGSVGFTAPNPVAQSLAIRAALADAHVDPRTIGYVETHGTGTQLGDPIEMRGLEMAYCDQTLWDPDVQCQAHTGIGSIKPNIGHLEAGAGLVGVVKAALQLHHRMLLPSITSEKPNPQIPFGKIPFEIQRDAKSWEPLSVYRKKTQLTETLPRRAAVNSFGVGGSNAHIILEEAPGGDSATPSTDRKTDRSAHLLTLQAPTPEGLRLQAATWSSFLKDQNSKSLGDAFYSNLVGRKSFEYKAALLVDDPGKASIALERWSQGSSEILCGNGFWKKSNRIAYLFTGQGAQYPGMLHELYRESPLFHEAVDQCAKQIDPKLEHSILDVLFSKSADTDSWIHQTKYTQPAIFIAEYALYKLLESYGIEPELVLGHSIGEIAAYCATGGCSLADALELVRTRGDLMQNLPAGGGMVSVAASAQSVEAVLGASPLDLSIAAYNGPQQTVVSGSLKDLDEFSKLAVATGIKTQSLKVSHAFHSKLMEPMLDEFRAMVAKLGLGVPQKEFVSTVTAQPIQQELASCDYWVDQVRKPVRFMQGMETVAAREVSHFFEVGPHPVLTTLARSMDLPNTDDSTRWLSSTRRGQSDWSVLLPSIGQLFVDGYPIDWARAEAPYSRHRVSVPGYSFSNRRIWLDEIDQMIQPSAGIRESSLEYQVRWQKASLVDSSLPTSNKPLGHPLRWLILSVGDPALARGLDASVRQHGDTARMVSWDPQNRQWGLTSSDFADHQRIVLVAGDPGSDLGPSTDVQSRCEVQIDAFSQAMGLARQAQTSIAVGASTVDSQTSKVFWLLTTGASLVDQDPSLSPIASTLWGGARAASMELPEFWGGAIDSSNNPIALETAYQLIAKQTLEDQVILSQGSHWVPRLLRLDVAESTASLPLGRSVLITGGLGAIGLRLADYAVAQGATAVYLVGRRAQPSPEQQQQLDRLAAKGVSVEWISADVASEQGIGKLAQALQGKPIETVLHTAGVDFLSPIAEWTREDVRRVTQAKIQGTWNLHQWSLSQPIKRFVLTSSIASVWGAPSRFLYASANAFLDAMGPLRRSQNLPVTVLNFGPWANGGMADEASLSEYLRVGMQGLDPDRAIESVGRLVDQGIANGVVTDTQWERFASVVSARRERPLFERLLDTGSSNASVIEDRSLSAGRSVTNQSNEPWISRLAVLDPSGQARELANLLRKEFAGVLKSQEERIPLDRNLYRLGLDSITAVEFSMRIKKGTGVAAGKWLSGEPTMESLASGLLSGLNNKLNMATEGQDKTSPDRPATAPWARALSESATQEQRQDQLLKLIQGELERFIGKSAWQVTHQTPMSGLGLDSLATVDFATQLRRQLGLSAPPRLMQYATLGDWISTVVVDTEQPAQVAQDKDVDLYEPSMHPGLMEFCRIGWPDRDATTMQKRWDWMFIESAKRLGVVPKVWLARDSGRIIGHMGAQWTRLKVSQDEITTAWFVDTMVLDAYRSKGVGAQILLQAEEDMPTALSLGQTAEVRRILDSLGWKQICPLKIHMFMNQPRKVFKGKLPLGADWLAAGYFGWNPSRQRGLQGSRNPKIRLRRVARFDSTHDELWNQMRQGVACAGVRDSGFLNWKYIEQPGQRYDCWEVWHTDKLIGVLVTKIEEPSRAYGYRRLHWVDVVCRLEPDILDLVIHGCIAKSTELGVDAISVQLTHQSIEQRLVAHGFVSRPHSRYLYASRGLVETYPGLDSSRWLVTHGDSDIDRPE